MKLNRFTQQDTWIALGLVPAYVAFLNYMLFGEIYFQQLDTFLLATLSTALIWTPVYFLHAVPAAYLRDRFPAVRQTWIRLCLALGIHILMSSAIISVLFYGYKWAGFPNYTFDPVRLRWTLVFSTIGNVIANVVHESVYTFEKWTQTLQQTEKLKKINLQSQLDSLKQQVNPHFLFNSLNSLSSLIDNDPEKAEHFVEELASVYRYLLQTNEGELTSLQTELSFINSYFHLLKTRYGNGIDLQVMVDDDHQQALLPPLTLQMLVENAVKHNVILPDQPLQIRIETDVDGRLFVINNVQRKNTRAISNGVGLANIATKYQLLGHGNLEIQDESSTFTVVIPLIMTLN
ncbi:sensor histidine kinase [Spirosoma sp. KNUC1025]|uniref:sensor histidine kinase n=1 Tax=Spirosoma sp. KNUC1025 TaxID=2894082 RepID=UPI00386FB667|nr:histidine kinase [Spirosoma sp. KNUC1025]